MIEVFKTNVSARHHARLLLARIHHTFSDYRATFDLDDCDRILRVEHPSGFIPPAGLIALVRAAGFEAEVLPDDV
ncbi:hypothetical protein SAMN02745146_2940 [Hymenobacter daecheongensis DSM 21074]|uniref:HMA domain-containing protein n=1 Tax=Hymenobacter daecheongensis DSM 21074 TaxID=1121955 RepID=A0A1M6IR21_9BACT|nr:hypothetical protein [Hymenobacter daecheongensis]SHJ36884.1 hypothetical protein SAMN02745146_2940 [Hymenobacter daecheongensis DSM 21074]